MDKFYMTGFIKYNENHDEKGRFGSGSGLGSTGTDSVSLHQGDFTHAAPYVGKNGRAYTLRIAHKENRASPTRTEFTTHIQAYNSSGRNTGQLQAIWHTGQDTAEVGIVQVHPDDQRNGLATAMLELSRRESAVPVEHSDIQSDAGKAWSAVTKFNHTHDAKGKFGSGGGDVKYNINNPGPVGVRNTEVAGRIGESVKSGKSLTATYTSPKGKEYKMTLDREKSHTTRVTVGNHDTVHDYNSMPTIGAGDLPGVSQAIMQASDDHTAGGTAHEVKWIEVAPSLRGQGIGTAMVEFARRESDVPIEHSTTLTDDGAKFTQQVKSFYQTGVLKNVGGDIHVDALLGSRTEKPKKKKPKHDGVTRVEPFYMVGFEKFNHNHDSNGRFSDNVGGGAHGIGVETPAMRTQNAERWATTVAARQRIKDLRVELNDVIRAETVVVKSFYQTGPVRTQNDDTAHVE